MGFSSKYSGEQIEACLDKIFGITVGTIEVTSTMNGHCHTSIQHVTGVTGKNLRAFVSVARSDYGSSGTVIPIATYSPPFDLLQLHLYGEGVTTGSKFTIHYLLI